MSEPYVSNVMSNKYDTALDFHVTMYDNLPYQRDSDYCSIDKIALNSGKVIKYFLYKNQPEVAVINNKDDEMEQYLLELRMKQQRQKELNQAVSPVPELPSDNVTDEQIQSLLDDQGTNPSSSFEADNDNSEDEILTDTTNPFADVEDW